MTPKTLPATKFDRTLEDIPPERTGSVIEVADTMFVLLAWFKDQGITPKAEDLIRGAELVLRRFDKRKI